MLIIIGFVEEWLVCSPNILLAIWVWVVHRVEFVKKCQNISLLVIIGYSKYSKNPYIWQNLVFHA